MPEIITTAKLYSIKDTHAISTAKNTVKHDGAAVSVGKHSDGYQAYGFLAFEDPNIPANAVIVSAELGGVIHTRLQAKSFALTVRPCSGAWTEAALTYNTMPTSSGVSDTVKMADTNSTFSADITSVAQAWFGGGYDYANGLYITSSTVSSYKKIYSRTAAAAKKPYIILSYYVPASQPTTSVKAAPIAVGTQIVINTNRLSTGYVHAIKWQVGSASGTVNTGVNAATTWTLTQAQVTSMLAQLPRSTSGTCTLTCVTTESATGLEIGQATTTLTLTVPTTVVPVISGVTVTGVTLSGGYYIQGRSSAKLVITAAAGGGSSVASIRTTLDGIAYTGASITTQKLTASGTRTIAIVATDARGRTATTTRTVLVYAYAAPKIAVFTAERSNSAGTAAAISGAYLRFALSAAGSSVGATNINKLTVRVYTKLRTATSWTLANTYTSATNSVAYTNYVLSGTYSALSSYDVKLSVVDTVGEESVIQTGVSTQNALINFDPAGMRVKFGGIAESDDASSTVTFGMDAKFKKKMLMPDGRNVPDAIAAAQTTANTANSTANTANSTANTNKTNLAALTTRVVAIEPQAWKALTLTSGTSTSTLNSNVPQYKVVGKHVYLRGSVVRTTAIAAALVQVASLPVAYAPKVATALRLNGSQGNRQCRVEVNASGAVSVGYCYSANGTVNASADAWYDITIDYWLD